MYVVLVLVDIFYWFRILVSVQVVLGQVEDWEVIIDWDEVNEDEMGDNLEYMLDDMDVDSFFLIFKDLEGFDVDKLFKVFSRVKIVVESYYFFEEV